MIIALGLLAFCLLVVLVVRWFHPRGLCRDAEDGNAAPETNPPTEPGEQVELSRRANLSKLKRKERRLVLQKLFESTTFTYSSTKSLAAAAEMQLTGISHDALRRTQR